MYRLEKVITSIVTSTFKPDWVSPLSDTIADLLEEKDWTKTQLAQKLEYTSDHVSELINSKAPITEETAVKLAKILGGTGRNRTA